MRHNNSKVQLNRCTSWRKATFTSLARNLLIYESIRTPAHRAKAVKPLIEKLISLNWRGLDIKKLRGYQNIFRLRKGEIRIIFAKDKRYISILSIDRRNESTYKF